MSARTTKVSTGQQQLQNTKPETSKRWLARQLLKPVPVSWQGKSTGIGEKLDTARHSSLDRPRTAPCTGPELTAVMLPAPCSPPLPSSLPSPLQRLATQHDKKIPSRSESGVVRDVNAWLESSSKPASPLMSGLPYWREGPSASGEGLLRGQFAIPIVHEPEGRTSMSSNQPLKSLCRQAKKIQARMPSLKQTGSQRDTVQSKFKRRSTSTPLLAIPYEAMQEGNQPAMMTRVGSVLYPRSRPATANAQPVLVGGWTGNGLASVNSLPQRCECPVSVSNRGPAYHTERQTNTTLGQANAGCTLRPMPSSTHMQREDSIGSLQLSDAPTYFTGPAPPSYRSRAASVLTTSSFGCIDGMNPEMRQLSQQRAQRRRGMKGKLKKFAQKALFVK